MDSLIASWPSEADGDLRLCLARGVAYQADMSAGRVPYDDRYFDKVMGYAEAEVARAVNAGRCAMLGRHLPAGARVLDVGAGSGAFVAAARVAGFRSYGWDVMERAVAVLKAAGWYAEGPEGFDAWTAWDSLEHMENPAPELRRVAAGAFLFVSLPIFADLRTIRESKHYRPGEHLYYFTAAGFIEWARLRGFRLLEQSDHEVEAGRESIGAFAFRRDLIDGAGVPFCGCGGARHLDEYHHPRRNAEFFYRCAACQEFGPVHVDREEARADS